MKSRWFVITAGGVTAGLLGWVLYRLGVGSFPDFGTMFHNGVEAVGDGFNKLMKTDVPDAGTGPQI